MSDGIRRCFQLIVYCMSRSYIHVLQARLSNRTARTCPCRPHDINFAKSSTQPEETSISASSRISNLTHRSYLEFDHSKGRLCISCECIFSNQDTPQHAIPTFQAHLGEPIETDTDSVLASLALSRLHSWSQPLPPPSSRHFAPLMASIPRLLAQLGVFSISWGSFGGIAFFAIRGLNSNNLRLSNTIWRMQEIKNIKHQNWSGLEASTDFELTDTHTISSSRSSHNPKTPWNTGSCTHFLHLRSGIQIFWCFSLYFFKRWTLHWWILLCHHPWNLVFSIQEHTYIIWVTPQVWGMPYFCGNQPPLASSVATLHLVAHIVHYCPLIAHDGIQRIGWQPQILACSENNRFFSRTNKLFFATVNAFEWHTGRSKPTCKLLAFYDILDCN